MRTSPPFLSMLLAGCCALALAPRATAAPTHAAAPALIPEPAKLVPGDGDFTLPADARITAAGDAERRVGDYLVALLARTTPLTLSEDARPGGAIVLSIDPDRGIAAEGYALDVDRSGVRVVAGDEAGLFYGAVTLWQLLDPAAGSPPDIRAVHITDAPRFAWRGLMLDSARHFQRVDEIKQLIDAMALHKLNVFHWHLTDDQGWRIEIKRYPKLTSVGGCRIPAGDAGVGDDGSPAPYCGFYTQDQIRDVVRYAAARHVTIVPEINLPGHATAAIAAYPELGVLGKAMPVSNEWGVNVNLFNVEPTTVSFLENVLAEVIDLFPGRYVHLGGDEAVKDQWQASSAVQSRMKSLGLDDEMQMQGHLVGELGAFLARHDRRLIGWDEILEGPVPDNAAVMSWRGGDGAVDAARRGHDVVMSPSSTLYLDYLQTDSPREPPGRPAVSDLRKVYGFEPVPSALDASLHSRIIGVQANVWTEHMRSFQRVEHAIFPRIAALAETAWSPAARKDYPGFLDRLPAQLERYRSLQLDYARTPFEVQAHAVGNRRQGAVDITLSNAAGYRDIRFTTDGTRPTATSRRYQRAFELRLPARVDAAVFVDGQAIAPPDAAQFDASSLLTRSDEQLAMCNGALTLRLEDDGPRVGSRAIFDVDIFKPCWEWKDADLDGIAAVKVRAGRMPYAFQLAHDEPARTFEPAQTENGELVVRNGCDGPPLARVPLPRQTGEDGFVELQAALPGGSKAGDLCISFTGDTRPAMWVVDRVTLLPAGGER